MKTRLAVLFGGRSGEHDVSRLSAQSILAHLNPAHYEVTEVLIERDGQWCVGGDHATLAEALRVLRAQDVVFPALHGPYGEDGIIQSMLEWLGVAYTGNGVFASAAGMDKAITKKLLAAQGLRVADGVVLQAGHDLAEADRERLALPVFVKPARAGSSLGVSKVEQWPQLPAALRLARESDTKVLIERAVPGREIDVGVLQHPDGTVTAGPPLEIRVPSATFFDYEAKYGGGAVFHLPAPLDPAMTRRLQDRAVEVFHALGCRGLLRVDFFVPEPDGEPVVNEINTFPGFTKASQYPQIWQRAGIEFPDLLDILIAGALTKRTGALTSEAVA
ncbi:D-alanine--D-alanine ligase family protein [Catelliglobosispora koreensis]|uniref:D-alanine--D-alanine ligase family protein n=1 Tax=Catelliglobosispora koreensis TaxID=129052 RepID=UPI00037E240C|nr:D-alanine--D-alanine ligase family protein [Catelliglobosispora koreensis]